MYYRVCGDSQLTPSHTHTTSSSGVHPGRRAEVWQFLINQYRARQGEGQGEETGFASLRGCPARNCVKKRPNTRLPSLQTLVRRPFTIMGEVKLDMETCMFLCYHD